MPKNKTEIKSIPLNVKIEGPISFNTIPDEQKIKKIVAGTYAYKLLELSLAWDKMCLKVIKATPLKWILKTNRLQRRITKTRLFLKEPSRWILKGEKL